MTTPDPVLAALTRLSAEVTSQTAALRDATTQLRWHPALRRRVPEAAAESSVRGAHASCSLEGVRIGRSHVRRAVGGGLAELPPGVEGDLVRAAIRVQSAGASLLDAARGQQWRHVVATLHRAAAADLVGPEDLGRPRTSDRSRDLPDIPQPDATGARERLGMVLEILSLPGSVPADVVAAVAHAELQAARPFLAGNGLVARAVERLVLCSRGLDPTGVAVWEVGHLSGGPEAYVVGLARYVSGDVSGWLGLWHEAAARAVAEGKGVADDVLAGRLTSQP